MKLMSNLTRTFLVRQEFTQEAEWRDTFGGSTPLLCFAHGHGSMDAPLYVPGGSMRAVKGSSPLSSMAVRGVGVYE